MNAASPTAVLWPSKSFSMSIYVLDTSRAACATFHQTSYLKDKDLAPGLPTLCRSGHCQFGQVGHGALCQAHEQPVEEACVLIKINSCLLNTLEPDLWACDTSSSFFLHTPSSLRANITSGQGERRSCIKHQPAAQATNC